MRKIIMAGVCALALAGCASSSPVTLQTVSQDIASIATGLNTALNNPAVVAAIPGGLPAKVSAALADLITVAQAAAQAPDATAMKGSVAIVESDVNVILGAVGSLPLPPPAPGIFAAVEVLLPAVEAAASTAIGVKMPAAIHPATMSVEAARTKLMSGG